MPSQPAARPREQWLALGPASRLLGVDPDTLRRWADGGRVRSFATPGGHRRFALGDLERIQARRRPTPRPLGSYGTTPDRLRRAYARTYRSTVAPEAARAVQDEDRAAFRTEGRELVDTLLAYLEATSQAERTALEERASEGVVRTARRLASSGVALAPAIEAFVAARRPLLQALETLGRRDVLPAARMTTLYADAAAILDRLLLHFVAAFQSPQEA